MQIREIYKKFYIPPNLEEHMFRVCEIVSFIEIHWTGEEVDWNLAKKLALLHDLANVVKFDLDKHPEFLEDEQQNVEYWKGIQRQIVEKYGDNDDEATKKMLLEIGIDQEVIEIIWNKRFGNSVATKDSNNWPLKIMYYADLRTLPLGIGTLEERIADVRERMPKYTIRPDFEDLVSACREIEIQIQQNMNISVSEINNNSVKVDSGYLLDLEVN